MQYEVVIGLEVHIQLSTRTKLFCSDSAAFGGEPNTHISPVTLAHPGTLPVLNRQAVVYAVRLGLALGSSITSHSFFDRKHYFYPDLPKGYQTSQNTAPILVGGMLKIKQPEEKGIAIHHVHLEEDAGKSIHDAEPNYSCIDLNRAGVPLLEMVTEPVLHSSDEAFAFITELRKLVRWLGICDGNMEEGSLRCDANVSIRPQGQTTLGTKVEVKNLNSIRNVKRAIEAEVRRQAALLDAGQKVVQQTRGYNADRDTTLPQRDKEEANDYRYLPCPDLPPFTVSRNWMQEITASMPSLPEKVFAHYTTALQLPAYDAQVLTEERGMSRYFGELITHTGHYKAAANWMLGPVKNWLNEQHADIGQFPLKPAALASVIELVQSDKVNFSMAATRLLPKLLEQPEASAAQLAAKLGIVQNHDAGELEKWVDEALAAMPDKVKEYQKGKKGLIGLFVGEVKKRSKGKADPKITTQMLEQKLKIS